LLMARRGILKPKAPGETVDYGIDWSDRLGSDTISNSTWSISGPDSSLTEGASNNTTTDTEIRLVGGTLDNQYSVKNTVVTAGGQTFEQTALLRISVR
jgi:hypothetical protein